MSTFSLLPGNKVIHNNEIYIVNKLLDMHKVLAQHEVSGEFKALRISELNAEKEIKPQSRTDKDIHLIADKDWQIAQQRFEAIRIFIEQADFSFSREEVSEQASKAQVSTATLYRWIKRYRDSGKISSLIPEKRGAKRGNVRLSEPVNTIINDIIENEYLTSQKRSIAWVCSEVIRLCRNAKLPEPHPNTIRQRIALLSEKKVIRGRLGSKVSEQNYRPHIAEFPDGNFPLDVVQIDHTKLDIVLVDDVYRMPVDRPWITLAIDVFSRMVTGFYISFDPPGALSTGLCLSHSILPKDVWLEKHGSHTDWPIWGTMKTIHADNAKEFRGEMLKRACNEYGIDLSWRPVARPHYGAHIERLLGTFNKEIHNLPGTTFNNPTLRKNYNSEKKAAMTLSEFERWLTIYITDIYHKRTHSSLECSPIEKFERGVFGDEVTPGTGLPSKIIDERRLKLDFMPFEMRTIQRYGVQIDKCHYYADVLRPYVNMKEEGNVKAKRKFLFRRDPRDISTLYFYDPELNEYFPIPYRNTSHPPVSIWEYRSAKKQAEGINSKATEDEIFAAYSTIRTIEENAKSQTKKIRRSQQRKRLHKESAIAANPEKEIRFTTLNSDIFNEVTPFTEMEVLDD